jgi:DNA primase
LVMKFRNCTFPEAVRVIAELTGIAVPSEKPGRPRAPAATLVKATESLSRATPPQPSGLPVADALSLATDAEKCLWTPEGRPALEYLRGRGLTEATIRAARLGWVRSVMIPTRNGESYFRESGVTIPWRDAGRLSMVKIRRGEGSQPKYREAYRDRPALYPGSEVIQPGAPLIVAEGEFDALLLGQELEELAAVVTLGSSGARLADDILWTLASAWPLYVATDTDHGGTTAAAQWPNHSRRVLAPTGKDWTEAYQAGIDLRRWWVENVFVEEFDRQERAAIMEFDGGLNRESAERAARLRIV